MRTVSLATLLLALPMIVSASEPWNIVALPAPPPSSPRILVIYDMEGLAGQNDIDTFVPSNAAYALGQRLLTDDVNAVIDGLFAGGAGAVQVADGHGGSEQIDILTSELDSRASMIEGEAFEQAARFDAIAIVGMHAGSGSGGFAAHTWTAGVEFSINGRAVNEAQLIALTYGERGVPVVFVSGDDTLGTELRSMPWIQYVTVKNATSITSANLIPLPQARAQLTAGARKAVKSLDKARLLKARQPVTAKLTAFPPASLAWLADMPGIDYRDESVAFIANDAVAAYLGLQALGTAAMNGYSGALMRALGSHQAGKEIELRAIAEWDEKWERSERERARRE